MGFQIRYSTLVLSLILLFNLTACEEKNFLGSYGKKNFDEALLVEADIALNDRDYDRALTLYNSMSSAFQAERETILKIASAYAGKCGLDFLTLVETLVDVDATSVFELLFAAFPNSTADSRSSCQEAEVRLRAIGSETDRSIDENLLVAFNAMGEIGNVLSVAADQNSDGVLDTSFDHCSTALLPDDQVDEVGAAIALIINSFAGIGEDFADVDSFRDQCAGVPGFARVCTLEDGGFTTSELRLIRAFLGSSDFGLGSCGSMLSVSCACP